MGDASPNVHVLDAAYKPFPTFSAWLRQVRVESGRWDRYQESLKESSQLSPEQLARAKNIAKRAAAFDTGAIEGLYDSDRGFTYTVAFETAAWEAALNQKGEQVRPLFEAQMAAYDYVLDLATKAEHMSEAAIRFIHEVVCRAQVVSAILCKRRSSGYGPVFGASSFWLVTLCPDSWNYSAGEDRRQGRAQRVPREP